MKQILSFFALLFFANMSCAQFDSAAIIQQHTLLSSKLSRYTNQPFSVLYNALTIKPKILTGFIPYTNTSVEYASQFHYADPNNPSYRNVYIDVEWETPIPESEASMYQNKKRRHFDTREYAIYANKIIKKVQFFPDPMIDENGVYMKNKPENKKAAVKKKVK